MKSILIKIVYVYATFFFSLLLNSIISKCFLIVLEKYLSELNECVDSRKVNVYDRFFESNQNFTT